MEPEEDVIIDDTIFVEEGIEPFDWEDHLYESWLEEQREQKSKRLAEGPI